MNDLKLITEAYSSGKFDESAEKLAGLLMDDSVSTYKLFEDIAAAYIDGSPEKREGIDFAFCAITGMHLAEFAKEFAKENKEQISYAKDLMDKAAEQLEEHGIEFEEDEREM